MRKAIAACAASFLILAFASSASAITYGQPDGDGHPEVGALLAPQAYSDGTWATCSGTLISPTVFLTAAHCDWGLDRMAVTFASTYVPGVSPVYWGDWHADPLSAARREIRTILPSSSSTVRPALHGRNYLRPARSRTCRRIRTSRLLDTAHSR